MAPKKKGLSKEQAETQAQNYLDHDAAYIVAMPGHYSSE